MKVVVARTAAEALAALADATGDSRILAGGTDLLVEMESGRTRPDLVVDVGRVIALRGIADERGGLVIKAGTTCAEILRSTLVASRAPILADAAREVGAVQIQNRATIGGNLGTASPAADLVPALFALDARVRLASLRGEREVAVADFVTGYRTTVRAPDELVAAVAIPPESRGTRSAFRKVGTRRAQSIAKVVVALAHGPGGSDARVAAGSVAERTVRLPALEAALARGITARADLDAAVAASAAADVRPRDDVRSSARYRRAVLARLLARMLSESLGIRGTP